ncbi:MAG: dipeptidase PepV [Anaeroplasmataceae bacterium]
MNYDFYNLALKYKDEAIQFLSELLKYNTILDEYKPNTEAPFGVGNMECLSFFLNKGLSDGFKVENTDNYAGHVEYGSGEEILGILGHLDVVPTPGNWQTPPFEPSIRNGRIYARGALDDKGPVVAAYYALKIIKDLKIDVNKRIRLIVGCDEESGSRCLHHYFSKMEMPSIGFSPDAEFPLIYGEKAFQCFRVVGQLDYDSIILSWDSGERTNIVPDKTTVTLNGDYKVLFKEFLDKFGYNGEVIDDKYITYGKNAHGSTPENGLNSNTIMALFINSIKPCNFTEFYEKYFSFDYDGTKLGIAINNKDMGNLSLNPGIIRIHNKEVFMHVDCRVPSNDHFKNIDDSLKKACSLYKLSHILDEPVKMHYVDPNSKLVTTLYDAYKSISNDNINKPFTIGGGTYAKFIPNCVAFGPVFPGEEECIHCPDEYMIIESFVKSIAIYAKSIYELVR